MIYHEWLTTSVNIDFLISKCKLIVNSWEFCFDISLSNSKKLIIVFTNSFVQHYSIVFTKLESYFL